MRLTKDCLAYVGPTTSCVTEQVSFSKVIAFLAFLMHCKTALPQETF